MINKKIEDLKKGCGRKIKNIGLCGEIYGGFLALCPECKAKLQAYEDAQRIICEEIEKEIKLVIIKKQEKITDNMDTFLNGLIVNYKKLLRKFKGEKNKFGDLIK